jgi:hypothetical protein
VGVKKGKGGESSHEEEIAGAKSKPTRGRKPYQKPAFQCERVFETTALSCGKINATQKHCRFNQHTS